MPVSDGAGEMSVIAWSIQHVSLLISSLLVVCISTMKSSMYTSRRWKKLRFLPFGLGSVSQLTFSRVCSSGRGGMGFALL